MQMFRAIAYAHVVNLASCLNSPAFSVTMRTKTSWTRSSAAAGISNLPQNRSCRAWSCASARGLGRPLGLRSGTGSSGPRPSPLLVPRAPSSRPRIQGHGTPCRVRASAENVDAILVGFERSHTPAAASRVMKKDVTSEHWTQGRARRSARPSGAERSGLVVSRAGKNVAVAKARRPHDRRRKLTFRAPFPRSGRCEQVCRSRPTGEDAEDQKGRVVALVVPGPLHCGPCGGVRPSGSPAQAAGACS